MSVMSLFNRACRPERREALKFDIPVASFLVQLPDFAFDSLELLVKLQSVVSETETESENQYGK